MQMTCPSSLGSEGPGPGPPPHAQGPRPMPRAPAAANPASPSPRPASLEDTHPAPQLHSCPAGGSCPKHRPQAALGRHCVCTSRRLGAAPCRASPRSRLSSSLRSLRVSVAFGNSPNSSAYSLVFCDGLWTVTSDVTTRTGRGCQPRLSSLQTRHFKLRHVRCDFRHTATTQDGVKRTKGAGGQNSSCGPTRGQRGCWVRGGEPGQAEGEGGVRVHSRRKTPSWGHGVGRLLGRAGDGSRMSFPFTSRSTGPGRGEGPGSCELGSPLGACTRIRGNVQNTPGNMAWSSERGLHRDMPPEDSDS